MIQDQRITPPPPGDTGHRGIKNEHGDSWMVCGLCDGCSVPWGAGGEDKLGMSWGQTGWWLDLAPTQTCASNYPWKLSLIWQKFSAYSFLTKDYFYPGARLSVSFAPFAHTSPFRKCLLYWLWCHKVTHAFLCLFVCTCTPEECPTKT